MARGAASGPSGWRRNRRNASNRDGGRAPAQRRFGHPDRAAGRRRARRRPDQGAAPGRHAGHAFRRRDVGAANVGRPRNIVGVPESGIPASLAGQRRDCIPDPDSTADPNPARHPAPQSAHFAAFDHSGLPGARIHALANGHSASTSVPRAGASSWPDVGLVVARRHSDVRSLALHAAARSRALHAPPGDGHALHPHGREIWRFATKGPIRSSPVVADGVVFVGSDDGNVHAVDAKTGRRRWRRGIGGPIESSPAVANGTIYIGSDDQSIYALDAATGAVRWMFATGGAIVATPAVAGNRVVVGSKDGALYALNATDGSLSWSVSTGGPISSSAAVADGVVHVGSDDGMIYAIDLKNGDEQWRLPTRDKVRASPMVAGGPGHRRRRRRHALRGRHPLGPAGLVAAVRNRHHDGRRLRQRGLHWSGRRPRRRGRRFGPASREP